MAYPFSGLHAYPAERWQEIEQDSTTRESAMPLNFEPFANLANLQSQQAQFFGNEASKVADPYGYERRQKAADDFDLLLSNPGSIETSPFYKYLKRTQMNATRAGNAAGGFRNSGRGQLALQQAASGAATKAFYPLAELYGKVSGATNELSPAAAGFALSGSERSQDYSSLAAAAQSLAARQARAGSGGTPWWMKESTYDFPTTGANVGGTGLPTGGTNYYPGGGSYIPSTGAGTGYMTSDYGTTTFNPTTLAGYQDYGASDPAAMMEQDYWGYE